MRWCSQHLYALCINLPYHSALESFGSFTHYSYYCCIQDQGQILRCGREPVGEHISRSCPSHCSASIISIVHQSFYNLTPNVTSKKRPQTGLVDSALNIQPRLGADFEIVQTRDSLLDRWNVTLTRDKSILSRQKQRAGEDSFLASAERRNCPGVERLDEIESEKPRGQTQVQSSTTAHPSTPIRHRHGHTRFVLQTKKEI